MSLAASRLVRNVHQITISSAQPKGLCDILGDRFELLDEVAKVLDCGLDESGQSNQVHPLVKTKTISDISIYTTKSLALLGLRDPGELYLSVPFAIT